jgi:hypothetical protein
MKKPRHKGEVHSASDLLGDQERMSEQVQQTVISKFWKSRQRNEAVWVALTQYNGHRLIDVRIYATGADGCDRPTGRGVALLVSKLPALTEALVKAERKARELGLLDQGGPA